MKAIAPLPDNFSVFATTLSSTNVSYANSSSLLERQISAIEKQIFS
jgi:hypothetical protein